MSCPRCKAAQTWQGSPRRCAFVSGTFSTDNWRCGTMDALRDWCEVDAACDSDQHAAFFPTGDGAFIVLGWHRFRGRTEYAGLLDETAVHDLTLARAEEVLS